MDQLCDLLQWSSSDFNQTGSQSILIRAAPQNTVHQSMYCQYSIRTVWSAVLMWEPVLLSITFWAVWWGVEFTVQTYFRYESRVVGAVWNFTATVWIFVVRCVIFTKQNFYLSILKKLSWSLIVHSFRVVKALKCFNTWHTRNLAVFARRFCGLWQHWGKNTTYCAGCKTHLTHWDFNRELCRNFICSMR